MAMASVRSKIIFLAANRQLVRLQVFAASAGQQTYAALARNAEHTGTAVPCEYYHAVPCEYFHAVPCESCHADHP